MNLAADLDDSTLDFINPLILFHNDRYGTSLTKEDIKSYHFCEACGGTEEDMNRKIIEFFDSDYSKLVLPINGSQQALKLLKEKGHTLFAVTGRGNRLKEATLRSINEHFPGIYSGIHHARSFAPVGARKKSDICLELGIDIIIDDDPMHIIDCANAGVKVIIYSQPWNQFPRFDEFTRIQSWGELPLLIN